MPVLLGLNLLCILIVVLNFYKILYVRPVCKNILVIVIFFQALDKLAEAQNYFNKNNPQSVELENIVSMHLVFDLFLVLVTI